ncbi:hypothetical protein OKW96_07450 [Sphingobacterium sp. KU25419]|nr:hypothetical protein OKW96_07450 [Sphingobacterium sp. KU25419]
MNNPADYQSLLQRMTDNKFEYIELNKDQTLFEYLV